MVLKVLLITILAIRIMVSESGWRTYPVLLATIYFIMLKGIWGFSPYLLVTILFLEFVAEPVLRNWRRDMQITCMDVIEMVREAITGHQKEVDNKNDS